MEGDGFQADALADNSYCYQFYMQKDPQPIQYRALSALHARVMVLLDTLKDKYHHIIFHNLYNSVMFCQNSIYASNESISSRRTQKDRYCIPSCVAQQELTNRTAIEGDPNCPCLIASSVYDTKLVHYLSLIMDTI